MKTILVTGFEPFGGDALNPSWQVAQALDGLVMGPALVCARQLPCVFGRRKGGALHALDEALQAVQPHWVLALGLAANRTAFSVERVAINVDDARIPDNAGAQPVDMPVVARAPAAYFSTLPIKAMVLAAGQAGLPAEVSQTAGTFVCNHVFFGLMHRLAGQRKVRGGFAHVPATTALDASRTTSLDALVRGVQAALQVVVQRRADVHAVGGAIA
jgi:pyroglutamyl-peptidase